METQHHYSRKIRRISLKIETNISVYDAMDEAKTLYYTYKQEVNELKNNILGLLFRVGCRDPWRVVSNGLPRPLACCFEWTAEALGNFFWLPRPFMELTQLTNHCP